MPILTTYRALRTIALDEFADVTVSAQIVSLPTGDPLKLRLDIVDGSLLNVFISVSEALSRRQRRSRYRFLKVTNWLISEVGNLAVGDTPTLIIAERAVWRVPVQASA